MIIPPLSVEVIRYPSLYIGLLSKNVAPTINAIAINNFKLLRLKKACLTHFQLTATKKIKINKSVTDVPIATPMDGFSLKTYFPRMIDKAIFKSVPPSKAKR